MIEPIDIWRSAKLMVDKHGSAAPQECRRRSIEVFEYVDEEADAFWEAVARAAESLLVDGPPKDIPRHSN